MFILNPDQEFVTQEAIKWYYHGTDQVFQFTGGPGTGKSVVINEIITRLGLNPVTEILAMSFIGSASLVMRMKGLYMAKTIHSSLYDVVEMPLRDDYGKIIMDNLLNVPVKVPKFIPVKYLDENIKLIVIDEGYTVPLSMKKEIEKFGIKVLVAGDPGQLPPIQEPPAYLIYGKIYRLRQVMRQMGRDDITYIANRVRVGLPIANGFYGNSLVINREDLTDEMLLHADVVICGKNKTRDHLNNRIRSLLGYSGKLPQYGEKVVARKNNWLESVDCDNGSEINIVNGLIGRVVNCPDISTFDGKMFSMDFKPDLINVKFKGTRCNYNYINADYVSRKSIKHNKYEVGNLFEYAYCITGWVSQGMEWGNVIYIEERMDPSIQCALNTVGASRANRSLIYVKA